MIDYVITNREAKERIERLNVRNKLKSDHLPIEVEIEGERRREVEAQKEPKSVRGREAVRWDEDGIRRYKERLRGSRGGSSWKEIKERIRAALPMKEGKKEGKEILKINFKCFENRKSVY